MTSSRKTIGLFVSRVGRGWGTQFLAGVTDAAEELDVNLVHFIGGSLKAILSEASTTSFGLYDLAKPDQFDGLLLASDVGNGAIEADLKRGKNA